MIKTIEIKSVFGFLDNWGGSLLKRGFFNMVSK